jgi:hypothetical protein
MANSPLNDLINKFGADVVEKAMQNLGAYRTVKGKKRRAVASDNLRKSLGFYYNSKKGLLEFFAKGKSSNYADFVEQGVNGTRGNVGSPYSFKSGASGGQKVDGMGVMQKAIYDWMSIKGIKPRNKNGSFATFKTPEAKENAKKSMAFNIMRSIRRRGIQPLFYWRDAVNDLIDVYEPQFAEALGKEIKIVIEDNLQKKIKV